MYTTYVPQSRASKFEKEFGEADSRTQHGEYIALHYEKLPEGVIKGYGGGWYSWRGHTQGREAAFEEAGRHF